MNLSDLTTSQMIGIIAIVVAIVIVIAVAIAFVRKSRTERLRKKFGEAEYERAVAERGRTRAEEMLEQVTRRVSSFHLRPLADADRARFQEAWARVQARFVDGPAAAVTEADQLLGDVMAARGYPVSDFETRAADISVDHPTVVQNYRAGHEIALRHLRGQASTEDLRRAMIHYRTLFEDLVEEPGTATPAAPPADYTPHRKAS